MHLYTHTYTCLHISGEEGDRIFLVEVVTPTITNLSPPPHRAFLHTFFSFFFSFFFFSSRRSHNNAFVCADRYGNIYFYTGSGYFALSAQFSCSILIATA